MAWLSELRVETVDPDKYRLLRPLTWRRRNHRKYTAPAGFVTDFATVPRPARWLVTGHDRTRKPAVLHDYLVNKTGFPRREADQIFKEAMEDSLVPTWKIWLCYSAVSLYTRWLEFRGD